MFNKGIVIINEQHSLLEEQRKILNQTCSGSWDFFHVPENGWTADEIDQNTCILLDMITDENVDMFIFASPVPLLLKELLTAVHFLIPLEEQPTISVFFNEKREKKELPDGKIISVTAKTGWELR